jgi:hypothetical protein
MATITILLITFKTTNSHIIILESISLWIFSEEEHLLIFILCFQWFHSALGKGAFKSTPSHGPHSRVNVLGRVVQNTHIIWFLKKGRRNYVAVI